jgi:glutamate 5-kinase
MVNPFIRHVVTFQQEIRFGDNDTLSAITASMIHADFLFLLTDVDGLYTSNPRKDPSAKLLEVVTSVEVVRSQVSTNTLGSSLGTGGMETKLIAAEIATAAGVATVITNSKRPQVVCEIVDRHAPAPRVTLGNSGTSTPTVTSQLDPISMRISAPGIQTEVEPASKSVRPLHTLFMPATAPLSDLKAWATHTLRPAGAVIIDTGAHTVLGRKESGGRLLPAGVIGIQGVWAGGQAVRILIQRGKAQYTESVPQGADAAELEYVEVGRGLSNYNSEQIEKVKGLNRFVSLSILLSSLTQQSSQLLYSWCSRLCRL